jgi:hypothetical protein
MANILKIGNGGSKFTATKVQKLISKAGNPSFFILILVDFHADPVPHSLKLIRGYYIQCFSHLGLADTLFVSSEADMDTRTRY